MYRARVCRLARVGVSDRPQLDEFFGRGGCIDRYLEAFRLTRIGLSHLRAEQTTLREGGWSNRRHEGQVLTRVGRSTGRSWAELENRGFRTASETVRAKETPLRLCTQINKDVRPTRARKPIAGQLGGATASEYVCMSPASGSDASTS